MNKIQVALITSILAVTNSFSQIFTKEDSLSAGLIKSNNATVLSGYGSFNYQNNLTTEDALMNLDRVVLFVGHKFNQRVSFFSELELEDAKIVGGKASGEISMEQAFLKFNIDRNNYLVAGLFIPRIGIINENHLPTTFNGNARPFVEKYIIPATWRELGINFYGSSKRIAGLNYTIGIVNGLSSKKFEHGTGIREGRSEGSNASGKSLAVTASLLHYYKNFRSQVSLYYGGSAGIKQREADSLQLKSGVFASPVGVVEANVQYQSKHFSIKALASFITLPSAREINKAYANNTPEQLFGWYLEGAYNIPIKSDRIYRIFTRYEHLNMNYKVPENGIINPTLNQQYLVSGFCFQPTQGVLVKVDYTYRLTGDKNPDLAINPFPQSLPYSTQQHIITLGIGYSF
jgi:hypothetical protein